VSEQGYEGSTAREPPAGVDPPPAAPWRASVPVPVPSVAPGPVYPPTLAVPIYPGGGPGYRVGPVPQSYPGGPGPSYPGGPGYPGGPVPPSYPGGPGYPPAGYPGYREPPRRGPAIWIIGIIVTVIAVVFTSVGLTIALDNGFTAKPGPTSETALNRGQPPAADPSLDQAAVTAQVEPGVVNINTVLGYRNARAAGTGMVLTATGLVLTNNHVIADATQISITDVGDGRTYRADVVGYDVADDVAVLRMEGATGLSTIPVGDSTTLSVGDPVLALGNAGGNGGEPTVVTGTVTALNRSITATDTSGGAAEQLNGLIQVAAAIESGDSGGPLVDREARVVGMNTAAALGMRFQASGGVGFAIPINAAMAIERQIVAGTGSATIHIGPTAFLGVQVEVVPNTDGSGRSTTRVTAVVNDSPADQAGLAPGDVIQSMDGKPIDTLTALPTLMAQHHPGDDVVLVWLDQLGGQHAATVTLATGPAA
jgi:S1-C subfamily serine protease